MSAYLPDPVAAPSGAAPSRVARTSHLLDQFCQTNGQILLPFRQSGPECQRGRGGRDSVFDSNGDWAPNLVAAKTRRSLARL